MSRLRSSRFVLSLLLLAGGVAEARLPRFRRQAHAIGTRNRVHVNRLITEAGTLELEIGVGFGADPALLKYTAEGDSLLWGRTEYSVGFDYLHGSNDVTLAANSLLLDGVHWNVSVGPAVTIVRQDGSGLRGGGTVATRYDRGLGSVGATANWSKATRPGAGTPADVAAFGLGGGVRLGKAGWRGKLTLNGNLLNEHASSTAAAWSTFEGLEWEATGHVSANVVVQQIDWGGANRDKQVFVGLTVNFGRVKLH